MKKDIFAIVIPVYKVKKSEYQSIVDALKGFDYAVVVDDSGSFDLELEEILMKNNCHYLFNQQEIGLSESVNIGIEYSIQKGASWVLIFNQDNSLQNDILSVYKTYINLHNDCDKIAILAPQYNYDRHPSHNMNGYSNLRYTDLTGSLVNVMADTTIGGYDKRFFIDGLDTEWCLRAKRKKYRIVRCNEAIVNHHPGETREVKIGNRVIYRYGWHSATRYYYQYRAAFLVHKMYHDLYSDMFFFYKILKAIFLFQNKKLYTKALRMAFRDYKNEYYGVITERLD